MRTVKTAISLGIALGITACTYAQLNLGVQSVTQAAVSVAGATAAVTKATSAALQTSTVYVNAVVSAGLRSGNNAAQALRQATNAGLITARSGEAGASLSIAASGQSTAAGSQASLDPGATSSLVMQVKGTKPPVTASANASTSATAAVK